MIKIPTVLVLGAGASAPFGFPTGQTLKDQICAPEFRRTQVGLMNNLGFDYKNIEDFTHALSRSGRPSVDAFLEHRDDFVEIGRSAIASILLERENTGELFENWITKRGKSAGKKEGNWYDSLFGVLCDGVSFKEVGKNKLSIITFNYDRSLEQYLLVALRNSYNKSETQCAEELGKIPIIHVHGSLGSLPWQSTGKSQAVVAYDSNVRVEHVRAAAESIRIIPEATTDTPEFIKARNLISTASRLLFLGFGYHPANMKRLVPESVKIPAHVSGTSLGLSYGRKRAVERWNQNLSARSGSLIEKNVYSFLHEDISFSVLG